MVVQWSRAGAIVQGPEQPDLTLRLVPAIAQGTRLMTPRGPPCQPSSSATHALHTHCQTPLTLQSPQAFQTHATFSHQL